MCCFVIQFIYYLHLINTELRPNLTVVRENWLQCSVKEFKACCWIKIHTIQYLPQSKVSFPRLSQRCSMVGLKDPEDDIIVPKYLYLLTISSSFSPYLKTRFFGVLPVLLKIMILLFFRLTVRFHFSQYCLSLSMHLCKPVSDKRTKSSAKSRWLKCLFSRLTWSHSLPNPNFRSSINRLNNNGDRLQPCFNPSLVTIGSIRVPLSLIRC